MITLTFRAVSGDAVSLVRGAYFRICADGTLRGPDNAITASYTNGIWKFGHRRHRMLECREALYLRVTSSDGRRECIGPYESLKVTGGAIFSNDTYLGAHAQDEPQFREAAIWREIALLSDI